MDGGRTAGKVREECLSEVIGEGWKAERHLTFEAISDRGLFEILEGFLAPLSGTNGGHFTRSTRANLHAESPLLVFLLCVQAVVLFCCLPNFVTSSTSTEMHEKVDLFC